MTSTKARHPWMTLGVMCLSLTIIGIDNSVLNVALPTLVRDLNASSSELQWIIDAYILVFAGLLLTGGSLGDRFGRRRVLTIGLLIFGGSSGLAAFASNANQLVIARACMGAGAALIMPATLSIITNVFTEPKERGRAIGIWAGVAGIGIAIGPIVGGLLLDHFWWGSVFFVNVPIVAAALVLGRFFVPESKDPSPHRIDPVGALLSIVGLSTLIWTIIGAPERGWTEPASIGGFLFAIAVLVGFVAWESRIDHPMLDLSFFKNPRFSVASLAVTSAFFAMSGLLFVLTQQFQSVMGTDALGAGLRIAPLPLMFLIGGPLAPRFVERFGTKRMAGGGLAVAAVGMTIISRVQVDSSYLLILVGLLLTAGGLSMTMPSATESIMGSVPREKAGVGSAMNDTTRQTGGALGVAVIGSILVSTYRANLGSIPGISTKQLEQAKASVGSAVELGTSIGGRAGDALVSTARQAFEIGVHASLLVGAAVLVVGALLSFRYLPAWAKHHELNATELLPIGMVIDDDELVATPSGGAE
jgi:EmrB/QacA subfamily drug resistance transporter